MVRFLHTLSAILFYALGAVFFLAYALFVNDIGAGPTKTFMEVGDLPLLCVALLYAGSSLYLSLTNEKESKPLGLSIGIPIVIVFITFVILKFL